MSSGAGLGTLLRKKTSLTIGSGSEVVGRGFCLGKAGLLSRYKLYARDRATRTAGWRRNLRA